MSYGGGYDSPYGSSSYGNYPVNTRPTGAVEKVEENLALSIKKALSSDESAPKQKHVRACIVYSWDTKSSVSIWTGMKLSPILGDEVMCFKALITIHKIVREGHPNTLREVQGEIPFIESIARSVYHQTGRGYGVLIRAYVQYLLSKMEFHRLNKEFNGNFEYEEYISLKGTVDPNEGYEKVTDLLSLLDKLDSFQKLIFANFRPTSNNECRIAALVPLVEESYGIYCFLKSMLTAMHQRVATPDPLLPLVQRFNAGHYALLQFYYECSTLKYLTSLIAVPKLPPEPPSFVASGPPPQRQPTPPPRQPSPPVVKDLLNLGPSPDELARQQMFLEQQRMEQLRLEQARAAELERQRLMAMEQQRLLEEQERMRRLMEQQSAQQSQQIALQRLGELERELLEHRERAARDRETIDAYDRRMKALEQQLQSYQQKSLEDPRDDLIRRLQEEVAHWKNKYEALSKLYASLRKEHLDLLAKLKDLKMAESSAKDSAKKEVDAAQATLRAKSLEHADALRERDRLQAELDRSKGSHSEELERLRKELENTRAELASIGKSKGAEVEAMLARFNNEKRDLEDLARRKQETLDELQRKMDMLSAELAKMRSAKEEEVAVLQSGMDQSLMALGQLQRNAQETEGNLLRAIDKLTAEHADKMSRIMDNIIESSIQKIQDAVFELESPNHQGNVTTTPEYVLTMADKAGTASNDFTSSFIKLVQTGDYTDSINYANQFALAMAQLLYNAKGVTRLAGDDDTMEKIIRFAKNGANGSKSFFENMKSNVLAAIASENQPNHIGSYHNAFKDHLGKFTNVIENLVVKDVSMVNAKEEELGDLVEREMMAAAKAIEEAAKRLATIHSRPTASTTELNVHRAILDSAMAMTNAIANLIKYATLAQQEIVVHGRGASTKGAFYKKNNRWTEGLISAAKAVAVATNILVECADGVVQGTHSLEQLVVAATEVSAATTQLVAASRVKAVPGSKTQDKLEDASSAVREAVKLLVKAAKEASKKNAEERILEEVKSMGPHEYKVKEMEQQVKILELEKDLGMARQKLSEMRRKGYQDGESGLDGKLSSMKI